MRAAKADVRAPDAQGPEWRADSAGRDIAKLDAMDILDPVYMDWPHVYRVTLRGIDGQTRIQDALSFFGRDKAIAMVVQGHASGWFGPKKTWSVFTVEVEDRGLAPKNKDGTVGCPAGCWDDRSEF
jgi:hypothetical protein